jgi:hypothetical protein
LSESRASNEPAAESVERLAPAISDLIHTSEPER